jgi:iron(III) transport system ATP-binding protein
MLLDEPFSALDSGLRVATRKAVANVLAAAEVTTILVTHDQAEALSFADRLGVMREGRLVQIGRPMDLYQRPQDAFVAAFLGEAIILPAQFADGIADCALGRVPVDDAQRSGTGRIMLRPEQLHLSTTSDSDSPTNGCVGTVAEIDYGGPSCMVVIRLPGNGADPARTIAARSSGSRIPAVGETVQITVIGTAHILSGPQIA